MHDSGDARSVVRAVRLKLAAAQGLLEGLLAVHSLIDRIGLVAVCHDGLISENAHRGVDNEARVLEL